MPKILNLIQKDGLKIIKLLKQNGFEAFWVGGTVRDMLLSREINNLDIATSARPEEVEALLNHSDYHTKPVGVMFGTILAISKNGPIEITTFRKEGQYLQRRKPKEVQFIKDYFADSQRRDFTINSLYYDPVKKVLLDPQKGQNDLNRKLIKFVGDPKKRIDEDALRMLRAVRFSAQLDFKLEKNSFAAIKTRAKYIQQISGERIKCELDKILASENKQKGIFLLDELGLLKFIMPEVDALKKVWHKSKYYHLEGSAFDHTMLALKNTPVGNSTLAYAALYHDTGKALTATPKVKQEGPVNSFPKHEFVSADLFKIFSKRLKFSRKESDLVLWITKMHMVRSAFVGDMRIEKKIALAKHKYFPDLIELWRIDSISNLRNVNGEFKFGEAHAYLEGIKLLENIQSKKKLIQKIVRGDMIMKETNVSAGPKVGLLKNNLENKIICGEIKNIKDAKIFLKKYQKNT